MIQNPVKLLHTATYGLTYGIVYHYIPALPTSGRDNDHCNKSKVALDTFFGGELESTHETVVKNRFFI